VNVKLEKATIEVLDGSNSGNRYTVLFNPFEYSLEHGIAYKVTAIPGLGGPLLQFINGDAEVLSMELFLDDYTDAPPDGISVSDRMNQIAQLLEIDAQLHAPPPVRFVWGNLAFKALLEKLSRKITLFRPDGTPARATLNVSFKEYKTLAELVNDPRLESADKTKRRVIVGNDSLWAMAGREYGDVTLWREIAECNDLDDPRDIQPGDWVTVPALENLNGSNGLL
jgi:nucleoid-associated protein YgaU